MKSETRALPFGLKAAQGGILAIILAGALLSVWQKTTLFQKCIRKQIEVYNIHLSLNIKTTLFVSPPGFLSKIHRFGAHFFCLIHK